MPPKTKLAAASTEPVSLDAAKESVSSDQVKSTPDSESKVDESKDAESDNQESKGSQEKDLKDTKVTEDKHGTEEKKDKEDNEDTVANDGTKDESSLEEVKLDKAKSAAQEEENAPPPPARPANALSKMQTDLQEAFPQVEEKYIKAFLIASEGRMDPAFNALLSLSDPNFTPDPIVPQATLPRQEKSQVLTDDELLARKLQKEFNREERRRHAQRERRKPTPADSDDSPDEIDQLKEQFAQGFEEAKTTLNGWVSGLTKKFSEIDGSSSDKKSSPKLFGALGGSSFNSEQEKRFKKFDEDPEILSSDFSRNVNLREERPPSLPKRHQKQDDRWQPLNSDVPVNPDAFLVTDSEDEDKK